MGIRHIESDMDVVTAAKFRVKNTFGNGLPVYMSFSGGKDSIALGQIVLSLIESGEIDPAQLTVQFIDEEAIFPCIEQSVMNWRRKFIYAGAAFEWFCVEVRHYSCFNELTEEEAYVCWDSEVPDRWVRQPPTFAVRTHPLLRSRRDRYQEFLPRICSDGITITGVRAAESFQRLSYMANLNLGRKGLTGKRFIYPMYDWKDSDIWLFIQKEGLEIPEIYLFLWQTGTSRNQLRVSQFFSIDTAKSLVRLVEYYPDLMDRIIKREPNAYLAAMYWDSEMFGRRTRKRRELERDAKPKDYKKLLIEIFADLDKNFPTPLQMRVGKQYRHLFLKVTAFATDRDYRDMYEAIERGDPKLRTWRALNQTIFSRYNMRARLETSRGGESG